VDTAFIVTLMVGVTAGTLSGLVFLHGSYGLRVALRPAERLAHSFLVMGVVLVLVFGVSKVLCRLLGI
jgi:hypothetical protein